SSAGRSSRRRPPSRPVSSSSTRSARRASRRSSTSGSELGSRRLVVTVCLALGLAALLNAQGLRKTAVIQPQGVGRDVALAVTAPLVRVSHFLYLDRPRQELKEAIGRGDDDRVDTRIVLPAVPAKSAAPRATPARAPRLAAVDRPHARPRPAKAQHAK